MLVAVFGYFPTVFQRFDVGEYRLRDDHPATAVFHAVYPVAINQLVDSPPTSSAQTGPIRQRICSGPQRIASGSGRWLHGQVGVCLRVETASER